MVAFDGPSLLLCSGRGSIGSLDLSAPASAIQICLGLVFGGLADFNVVHHCQRTGHLRQTGCCALVLNHLGEAFECGNSALHMRLEFVAANLRSGELRVNRFFEIGVADSGRTGCAFGSRFAWRSRAPDKLRGDHDGCDK